MVGWPGEARCAHDAATGKPTRAPFSKRREHISDVESGSTNL